MDNIFSSILISKRQAFNMTQEELADRLYVSRQTISKWEKGDSVPDIDKLKKLADIFSVDVNFFLYGEPLTKEQEVINKRTNGWDIIKYILYVIIIAIIGSVISCSIYFLTN